MKQSKHLLASSIALTLLAGPVPMASAQIEEIIVSARKQAESLQDVPVAVSAFDRAALERNGVDTIDDLAALTPGLKTLTDGSTSAQGGIFLRGVSTGSINVTSDQAVAINVDGVQIESSLGLLAGQIDLAQAEILKGPQALFFGKNNSGGVIALKTADPTEEFYVRARAGHEFDAEESFSEIVVSGPLTDTLGARGVIYYSDSEGYLDNTALTASEDKIGGEEELVVRGTLLWEPSDDFQAKAKVTYSDREMDQYSLTQKITCYQPAQTTSDCTLDNRVSYPVPIDLLDRYPDVDPYTESTTGIVSLDLNWQISDNFSLNSVTGYYDIEQEFFGITLERGDAEVDVFGPGPLFLPNEIINMQSINIESFSQEFRLTSEFDGPFNVMLGAFFDDRETDAQPKVQFGGVGIASTYQLVESESMSFFAQGTVDLSETVELSAGLRYTEEERVFSGEMVEDGTFIPGSGVLVIPGLPTDVLAGTPLIPLNDKLNASNISPEVTLNWQATDDVTLYLAYKEGFKSGSFDVSPTSNQFLAIPGESFEIRFENEEVRGGEFGFKTLLFDSQLRFNGAVYYYDYTNLQLSSFDPEIVSTRTINAGGARVRGFEFDLEYAPTDNLRLTAAFNYNQGNFVEFITDCNQTQFATNTCPLDVDGDTVPDSQSLAGLPLENAPERTGSLGIVYEGELSDSWTYRVGGLLVHSDEYFTDTTAPDGLQDSYTTFDANIRIATADEKWAFELIGKNLTDEDYFNSSVAQPFTGSDPVTGAPGQQDHTAIWARGTQITAQVIYQLQ